MIEALSNPDTLMALLALTSLEIVLGIDNIVFIAILTDRLPKAQQATAYRIGLLGALITRLLLLFAISWVMGLTRPLFTLFEHAFSGRDLILLAGGIFLIGKSAHEIYEKTEHPGDEHSSASSRKVTSFAGTIIQIMILDIVFSLDSVITAVGMADQLWVMIVAMVTAVGVMLFFAQHVGKFVNDFPSLKMLALTFLMMIGVMLTAEGMGKHIEKGYIYFSMGFALIVQLLNIRAERAKSSTGASS